MSGKLVRQGDGLVVEQDAEGNPRYRGSGKDLSYLDENTKERFSPHVREPSAGADRAAADAQVRLLQAGARPQEIRQAEAQVDAITAEAAAAALWRFAEAERWAPA